LRSAIGLHLAAYFSSGAPSAYSLISLSYFMPPKWHNPGKDE
jgi:hypothetical protein